MKKDFMNVIAVCIVFLLSYSVPSYAIVGVGVHWGFDFSLDMDDRLNERLSLTQISPLQLLDTSFLNAGNNENLLPAGITVDSLQTLMNDNITVLEASAPFSLSRTDWNRSILNVGGKVFVDVIPVIDAIELSFNIGAWEYDARLKYPTGALRNNITVADVHAFVNDGDYENILEMQETPLTLEEFGIDYLKIFGLSKTPYVKMHFDLSIRKNLVAVPDKLKIFKLYLGGGPSLHFGTPVISTSFVEDVIGDAIDAAGNNMEQLSNGITKPLLKTVIKKLINDSKTPVFGMHIIAGTMIKPPVFPIGIYIDGKYVIPFGRFDTHVDLGGYGFLINAGVSLSL